MLAAATSYDAVQVQERASLATLMSRPALKVLKHSSDAACGTCIGFRTGRQLAERYTANRARLGEPLEVIKFVCKEFWTEVFRKQACAGNAGCRATLCFGSQCFIFP